MKKPSYIVLILCLLCNPILGWSSSEKQNGAFERADWVYFLYEDLQFNIVEFENQEDDFTFATSLADDPCAVGSNLILRCGVPRESTNLFQQDNNFDISTYTSCISSNFDYSGRDQIYELTVPTGLEFLELRLTGPRVNPFSKPTQFTNMTANLDIFLYSCSTGSCVASGTRTGTANETVMIDPAPPPGEYYVIVDGRTDNIVSSYVVWAYCGTSDDPCANNTSSIPIVCNQPVSGNTSGQGDDFQVELYRDCFLSTWPYDNQDVMYEFQTPQGATQLEFLLDGLSADLDMFIYDCSPAGECVGHNVKSGFARENVVINNPSGTYYIIIDGEDTDGLSHIGGFTLEVVCDGGNVSDDPCNSDFDQLQCGETYDEDNINSESFFFADAYDGCSVTNGADYDGDDRLYRITATSPLPITIRMTDLNANLDMFLFDCTSATTCIDQSRGSGTSDEQITIDNPIPGTDYYFVVDGVDPNSQSTYTLSIECQTSDDPCTSTAMDLLCNQSSGLFNNNSGGSNFYADLYENCFTTSNPYSGNDRLFRYSTPQDVTSVTFNLTNLSNNLDLFIYNCSGLGTCIDRSTRSGSADESITISNPFGTYYLIVDARTANITSSFRLTAECELQDDPCLTTANLIDCNQTVNSSNFTSEDNFDGAVFTSCGAPTQTYDARDRVYELVVPADVNFIEVSLSGLAANLDLFVFDCNSATACLAASTNSGTDGEIIELDVSAGTYRIVIDGLDASQESNFTLAVNCCNDQLFADCDNISYSFTGTGLNFDFSADLPDWEQFTDGWIWVVDGQDASDIVTTGLNYDFTGPGTYEVCYDYIDNTTGCQVGCCNNYCIEDPYACGLINIQKDSFPGEGFQFTLLETTVSQLTWTMRTTSGEVTEIGTGAVSNLVLFDNTCPVVDICVRYYDDISGCWKICCLTVELCEEVAGCDDCVDCFFYDTRTVNDFTVSFYDNFCEAQDEFGNPLTLTYQWLFIEVATGQPANVTYLDGTSETDANPIVDFPGSGQYEACIQIFSDVGSIPVQLFSCCQTINLTETPCFAPPVAHFTWAIDQQTGWYYFDASSSQGASNFTWDIPDDVETVFVPGGQAVWAFFPDNQCADVCLLVNNACGLSSICQEFCSVDGCTEIPEPVPLVAPQINGQQVSFIGMPEGGLWNTYEWKIPAGATFANGTDANSASPVIDFAAAGHYRVCVTYYNGCTSICHCWTVAIQDVCAGVEVLTMGVQTLGDNTGGSSQFVAPDYDCYSGQSTFSAPDKIYEITKSSNEGDLTITLINEDLSGLPLDLDIFLLDDCLMPANCLGQSLNPFGQPYINRNFDAIHLPDFPAGTYYLIVDGYDEAQQGPFRITATEGDLFCDGSSVVCGQPISASTDGSPNNVSAYSCQPIDRRGGYTGPERVYTYQATFDGIVNVSLDGLDPQVDLDLLVLDACDQAANCLAYGKNPAGEAELLNLNVTAGQTYYIVIEGWDGSVGNFTLEIQHPTCAPVNTCDNLCAENCCDTNCNNLVYTIEDNYDTYSGYGSLTYRFENISGMEICKWEIDGIEVPGTESLDVLFYTLEEGIHTICMYLKVPGEDCVIQCCKTIYVQPPFNCGETTIDYELITNQGYRFSLNNGASYQTISWTWVDTDSPLGTGPLSNILDFPTACQSATVSVSYYDPQLGAWFLCSRTVWLCPPEDCGAGNIEYKYDGTTFVFDFDLPNTADLSTVTWSELETGLEFGQGQGAMVPYPGALPCEIRTICIRYFDYYTYSWYSCCRRIYLCDPFDCTLIDWQYLDTESSFVFNIPPEEDYTNVTWRIDSPTMAPFGTGYNSDLLPASTSCPTYVVTVEYYQESCECWRQCSVVFEACPPEDCGTTDPLTLPWLQALIDCDNAPCGLQVFACRYQGEPVITLRDNPYLCVFGEGQVYNCTGDLLFTYGGTSGINNDLAEQLTNCELIFECPLPSPEICDDGLDNDQDGLVDCEDPDCSFDIYFAWTDADCSANNGSATVYIDPGYVIARGILPTYEWSNGAVTQSINGVAPGTYSVTVTNDAGCQTSGEVTIGEKNNLVVDVGTTLDVICEGDSTLLQSQINGGKPPYSYAWSDGLGATSSVFAKPLETTTFYLTVTDINGCQAIDSTQVTVIPKPPIDNIDTICAPDLLTYRVEFFTTPGNLVSSDIGQIQDLGSGIFAVSSIPTGQDLTITVVDPNTDCVNMETVISPLCPCPDIPSPVSDGNQEICLGETIPPLTVPVLTGYNANWYDAPTGGQFLASTFSFVPPQAGTYYVDYEEIVSGCVSESRTPISLTIHPLPVVEISGDTILCALETSTLTASGADTYLWSTGETGDNITVATGGQYWVEGSDVNGCKDRDTITVDIAEPILIEMTPTDVSCFGFSDGAVTTNVSGGTPPYSYEWNTGTQAPDLSGLTPGRYILTITDARQCRQLDSVDILQPEELSIDTTVVDPICGTVANGSIEVIPNGGTPPYNFSWADDLSALTGLRTNLSAGSYAVTVTDQNDCILTASFTLTDIQELNLELIPTAVDCNGASTGSLTPILTGGTGPYSFLWSDQSTDSVLQNIPAGVTFSLVVTDAFGCTISGEGSVTEPTALEGSLDAVDVLCFGESNGIVTVVPAGGTPPYNYSWSNGTQATPTIDNLPAGQYILTLTDANDCVWISDPIAVNQPDSLDVTADITDATSCATSPDGAIVLTVTGGTPDYSYLWSTGATSKDLSGLSGGTYTVTVTDTNGCEKIESFTVNEPSALSVEVTQVDVLCNGELTGSLSLSISGGLPPYSVLWSDGTTGTDRQNLGAGVYGYTVTDANQCTFTGAPEITEPPALALDPLIVNITCFGDQNGSIDPQLSGGTPPYSYAWSNAATTPTLSDLGPGVYSLVVTDANDCVLQSGDFEILEPTQLTVTGEITDATSCATAPDGAIVLTVAGGTPDYTYAWSTGATTKDISGLSGGAYTVTVTDANNCEQIETYTVNEPSSLSVELTQVDVLCNGETTGSLSLTITGGLPPYSVSWSDGTTGTERLNLGAGTYGYTVTDANQCTFTGAPEITEPPALALDPVIINITCFGDQNGSIDPQLSGGTPPYSYAWSNAATTPTLSDLDPGVYSLVVTDANDCVLQSGDFEILEPTQLTVTGEITDATSCATAPDGAIVLTVAGGTPDYTYAWSTGATTKDISGLSGGAYTVTVTDANNCEQIETYTANEPSALSVELMQVDVLCNGETTGSLSLTITGGLPPYSVSWSDGTTGTERLNLGAGTYGYTVTDANQCTFTGAPEITEPPALALDPLIVNITCFGDQNGSIDPQLSGGTPPYSYAWSNAATTPALSDLGPGVYSLVVTDANDCVLQSGDFEILEPTQLTVTGEITDATSCATAPDGAIVLTVAGGTPDYTYAWSTGATTKDISGLSGGAYTVTVTDANNCEQIETYTVSEPSSLSVELTQVDVLCNGETTGSLSLTITGGLPPYSVSWSDGTTGTERLNLGAGIYGYTVTDANQCTFTGAPEITEPPALALDPLIVNITCFGDQNGSIDPQLSGGTPPYSYAWSNAASTPTLSDLGPGVYSLVVTDANDCVLQSGDFEILEPTQLTVTGEITDATSCATAPDGAIVLTVAGGTPDYTYAWSTGATTKDIGGLSGGAYTVTVTDANNCEQIETYTVSEPSSLSVELTQVDVLCNGELTGSLSLSISGGLPPYSVLWSDGATGTDRQNLGAGVYGYTVTDANQCTFTGAPEITEPSALALDPVIINITCFGDQNGSIDPQLSGGTPPYSYAWSNAATTPTLSDLGPGVYSLVVTDANDCVLQSGDFEILEPTQLTVTGEITDATSCATAPDGAIVLTVAGGTPDYTYAWSTGATTKDISGLSGGAYTVTVTDANNCEQIETYTVNEPSSLSVELTQVDVLCNGETTGSLSLTITGGLPPYSVSWSDGATGTDRQNLGAGVYGYTVTDANQCTFTGAPEITEPPALALDPLIVNVTCFGDQNGSIDPQLSGGTPPYSYAWSNAASTPTLSDLGPGVYSLVVTDANDCVLQSGDFEILEPSQLTVTGEITDATSCATAPDGAIVLTVAGGTPDYTYAWSTGATTEDISGLSGGAYTVTVTDANNCEQIETYTVNEPSSLSVELTQVDVLCNGELTGSLSLSISGGLPPYSVLWSDGTTGADRQNLGAGVYGYTVTDANQCTFTGAPEITEPPALALDPLIVNITCFGDQNGSIDPQLSGGTPPYSYAWSNAASTPTLSDLGPGVYSLVVTDANDCVLQSGDFEILEPTQLTVTGEITDATSCATAPDGAIVLTVAGGTPDYTYAWSTGATTKDISGLSGGAYTITVTDANNCEQIETYTVSEPSSLSVELTQVDVLCNGETTGSLSLTITGGLPPYSVSWSDGATGTDRQNLGAGIYGYTVTDANQCTFTGAPEITEPPAVALDPLIVNVTCFGDQNGSIDPQLSGGTPPYSYAWSNAATTPTLSDLGPGVYSLVVTDANDCVLQSGDFNITEPEEIIIDGTVTNASSCDSAPDGTITISVSGGTGDYSYLWSTGGTDPNLTGLSGGTYTLTVTDQNDCEQVASFDVSEPSSISADLSATPVSCFGESDGTASLAISGGLAPYTILWSDGSSEQDRINLSAGVYDVTVSDANDCTFLTQAEIGTPDSLEIVPDITNITCAGEADGRVEITLIGGTAPFTFDWSNGATSQDIQALTAGDYSVVVTDANGCVYESTIFSISEPLGLEVQSVVTDATACGDGTDGGISLTVTGGTGEYSYAWNTGDQTSELQNIGPGIYTVTVTDENDCSTIHERTVNQPQGLEIIATATNTTCVDAADGTISLEISRGIPPYSILWDDQSTATTRGDLLAGEYSFTVTDANNCEEVGQATVETPPPLTIDATILPISCAGAFDGGIVIQASGGTGGYRFEWSNDRDTPVNNALPAGEYTLFLRDGNDCLLDTTFILTEPPALFIEDFQVTEAACSGISNGSIDITMVGGIQPYEFNWSNGATTEDLVDVEGGEYGVTITDASGCDYQDAFTVFNTTELSASAETQTASCATANGSILLELSGGTEPYTFDWSIDGQGDDDDEQNPTGVAAGIYQVTIRDAAGCSLTLEDIEVEGKPAPVLSLVSTEQSICGEASGSVLIDLQGGAEPFSFSWSNGSTDQNLSGVGEGTYTLTVTDADQCQNILEVSITCFDPCALAVGTMGQEKLMGCQSQLLMATYDPTNEVVGEGEVRLFVIHNASGDMLGSSILNVSTDPTIAYTSALSPNVEYYLSAVVGKDDGNGLIDFNNSCLDVAPGTPFSFAPAPTGPEQLIATNSTLCPGQQLELKVELQIDGDPSYVWETPKGIITTTVPELIVNNFGAADVGEYLVAYNIGGCDSEQLGPLVVTLDGGAGEVSAGEDVTLCGDGSFVLEGVMPEGATGTWFTTSPAFIEDDSDPNSFVDSLVNGVNTFYWIVNTGACLARDTVEVYHAVAPTTEDRSITMEANQATLLLNKNALFDQITQSIPDSNLSFSIIQEPDEGQLTVDDESSQLIYQRDLDIEGDLDLEFIYEVCNVDPVCGELCSQSTITLSIKYLETEIISYKKGLRPDGKSPTWNITLLRDLTEAKLTIVDRWGKRIHAEEYLPEDNLSKGNMLQGWDGKNLAGVRMYTGAYYFIFEGTPTSGDKPIVVKGIVYLLK